LVRMIRLPTLRLCPRPIQVLRLRLLPSRIRVLLLQIFRMILRPLRPIRTITTRMASKKYVYRKNESGKFVSWWYAFLHPRKTNRERIKAN
jgi:hypothetical protein